MPYGKFKSVSEVARLSDVGWVGTKWKPTIFQRNGVVGFRFTPPYALFGLQGLT